MSDLYKKEELIFPNQNFESDDFFDDDIATKIAKKYFGIRYLFPWQKLVISNILDSHNLNLGDFTEDSIYNGKQIVLLPTGSGKSICFLLPALLLKTPTLVIYPLLALIKDQGRRLTESNISHVIFKGNQSKTEWEENIKKLKNGCKIILATPEILQNEKLIAILNEVKLSHIAIDEAHCISEWGDSFRPAYLKLGTIIKSLSVKTITAFTATASPIVLSRIKEILFNNECHIIQASNDRENIYYEVKYTHSKQKEILKLCKTESKPIIIFCSTRKKTEELSRLLAAYYGYDKVKFYHAGLTKDEKEVIEKWFFDTTCGILTATCAYGMGMDKANILTVIHEDIPLHLENYIQEAGRAGRNGSAVKSIILCDYRDKIKHRQTPDNSRDKEMGNYVFGNTCRRDFILRYLNGEKKYCSGCDICTAKKQKTSYTLTSSDGDFAYSLIKKNKNRFTKIEFINYLTKELNKKDIHDFKINIWDAKDSEEIISQLLTEKKIKLSANIYNSKLTINKIKTKSKIPKSYLHYQYLLRTHLKKLIVFLLKPKEFFLS